MANSLGTFKIMADELHVKIKQVLRERDIIFDDELLQTALADPETRTAIHEWVDEYLSPDTLLTHDEVNLFKYLTQTGEANTLSQNDLSLVLDLNSCELQTAIENLRKSTVAIEKNNEKLRLQQSALSNLIRNEKRTRQARSQVEKGQIRKWGAEKGSISAAISELIQSFIYQNSDLSQYLKVSEVTFKQGIESILRSDDRLLTSFQKLANDLNTNFSEDDRLIDRVKDLCARYIKYTVEGVRTRLDRIYLEALENSLDDEISPEDSQESKKVQEELESLYSEILPVAQISVEQQYLEPSLRLTSSNTSHCQERLTKAIEYIESGLTFLTSRIETYLKCGEEFRCHQMAVETILRIVKDELSYQEPALVSKSSSLPSQNIDSPTVQIDEETGPEQQLAQKIGIMLPQQVDTQTSATKLKRQLSERQARLESQESSLQSTIESSIISHVSNARLTQVLLRDVLLTNSPFHTVNLIDPELVHSVDLLETEITQAQEKLEAMDLSSLQLPDFQRDKFLERLAK